MARRISTVILASLAEELTDPLIALESVSTQKLSTSVLREYMRLLQILKVSLFMISLSLKTASSMVVVTVTGEDRSIKKSPIALDD